MPKPEQLNFQISTSKRGRDNDINLSSLVITSDHMDMAVLACLDN
jgi:hypothetical protein